MKKNEYCPDLRAAFPEMPEAYLSMMIRTARSVQDKPQSRKCTLHSLLVATVILVASTAVAIATTGILGWNEYIQFLPNRYTPDIVSEILPVTSEESRQVGPCTFTVREQLTDAHIAISTTSIRMADGSQAIFMPDCAVTNRIQDYPSSTGVLVKELGISPCATWGEAAIQLNLPLYRVRSQMMLDSSVDAHCSMEVIAWETDNSAVFMNMKELKSEAVEKSLPVRYDMQVWQIDPESGDTIEHWKNRDYFAMFDVQQLISEKKYKITNNSIPAEPPILSAVAQQYITGVYVTLTFENNDSLDFGDVLFTDENGNNLPGGMNPLINIQMDSYDLNTSKIVSCEYLIGKDSIPDSLNCVFCGTVIELR